jgi:hypothetical protein
MCLSIREIEALVDSLPQAERARLLEYLKPLVESTPSPASSESCPSAWRQFREVGDRLAASSSPGAASVTKTLTDARR